MRRSFELLRQEPTARVFFMAWTQSVLGIGASYVALLLVAFDRLHSPWAISAVLIADLLPPMFLGPLMGAAADRWSRKWCAVVSDMVRALAFVGIAFVSSFEATVALALVAGAGTALFTPATLAALPSLVERERLPAATSLYGAISDFGLAVGPAFAALFLIFGGVETILVAAGVTFAVSALILAGLDFGRTPDRVAVAEGQSRPSLFLDAREGMRAIPGIRGLRTVLGASAAALFFAGLMNVAEVPFITGDLDASDAVYSAAVAVAGAGIVAGSLAGGAGGALTTLRSRYLIGLAVMGLGNLVSGVVPRVEFIFITFALGGVGNGMMLVYERLIIQATVADELAARVFGIKDSLTAWAFGLSFLIAGALVSAFGSRPTIVGAGAGILGIAALAVLGVRAIGAPLAGGAELGPDRGGGEDGTHLVGDVDHWLTLLDDLREGGDDDGIELGPGVRR